MCSSEHVAVPMCRGCDSADALCRCKVLNGKDPYHYYYDPLKCPLPKAPSMSMYCLYGVGKPVERSYQYLHLLGPKVRSLRFNTAIAAMHRERVLSFPGWPTVSSSQQATQYRTCMLQGSAVQSSNIDDPEYDRKYSMQGSVC